MTRIGILSPSFAAADAVTNDALGMFDVLTRRGAGVCLFCESHALPRATVFDVSTIERFLKDSNDVLIYHYSRGWKPGLELLRNLKCRKVIKYHNVTPAEFFVGYSRSDQELCDAGRRQLTEVIGADCDLYLSASAFSMQELISLGAKTTKSYVVPPFHHIDRLATITADQTILDKYTDGKDNILSVGRVVPHKGHLQLLEVFAHYYYGCNSNSRLIIVGKGGEGHSSYAELLHRGAAWLGLKDAVVFTGGVSDEALKAYYLLADAFVTTSEHEGFCVPLVEAMSMRLPITAFASTAIPETLGDAGIVWTERDPLLIAESIDLFLKDNSLREALGLRGLRRYQAMFSNEMIEKKFLQALSALE